MLKLLQTDVDFNNLIIECLFYFILFFVICITLVCKFYVIKFIIPLALLFVVMLTL